MAGVLSETQGRELHRWRRGHVHPQTATCACKQDPPLTASCKVSVKRLWKNQMFFSSRTLGKAVLCIGKELSSVISSAGKSKSKLFKMTKCRELSHEGPRLLPLIYPDVMSFYLTRGKMAFYGDGIQRKTNFWTRLATHRRNPCALRQPYSCTQ